jgi:hypothetical protein
VKRILLLMIAASLALAGCFSSSSSSTTGALPIAPGEPTADVRVLHASADAPNVDIYVEGTLAIPNLAFGEATGFVQVPAKALRIDIRAAGSAVDSDPAFSATVSPAADASYTLVAYGLLGGAEDAAFDLLTIADDRTNAAEGFFRLFVLHAAVQAGTVDVYLDSGTSEELGQATIEDFTPRADTGSYLELATGTYRVRLTPAGETDVVYDSGLIDFQSGASYFVAALDRPSGLSPVSLVALLNDPAFVALEDQRVLVRALHLSPDAPAVDVLVNDTPVGVTLSFRDVSPYLTVLAGDYTLGVAPANSTTAVADLDVTVEAGKAYSIIATGLLSGSGTQALELRPLEDERQPAAGDDVLVRVIHAAPDAPAVDVLADGAILGSLNDVPYFTASGYLTVPAGSYDLEVRPAGGAEGSAVITAAGTALASGSIYTVIATGLLADGLQPVLVVD